MLMELRDLGQAEGWQILAGHCLDFGDSALPYLPFSEVLGRLAAELPDVVDQVASVHPALARLQPGRRVRSAGESDDGESIHRSLDRADLFAAVHGVLEAAAEKAPVLLVIEDVHWADQSTRDMLGFLFQRPFAGQVSIVASYRSDDLHRRHPLRKQVAEWARLRGVDRLQLSPLSESSVRELVAALASGHIGETELRDIIRRADGNAFFVEELVAVRCRPVAARRPRRRAARASRPARRQLPPGGAGGQRRRSQGRPRPARGRLRPRCPTPSTKASARPSR